MNIKPIVSFFFVVLLSFFCGGIIWLFNVKAVFFLLGLAFIVFSCSKPKYYLLIVLIFSLFRRFLENQLHFVLPFQSFMDEMLILLMLAFLFLNKKSFCKLIKLKPMVILFACFVFICVVSAVLNSVSFVLTMNFLVTYAKWLIFLAGIFSLLDYDRLKFSVRILFTIGFVELIVASIQFFTWGNLNLLAAAVMSPEDVATGTFGHNACHLLGNFALMLFIISLFIFLYHGGYRWLIASASNLFLFVLTFNETSYLFLAPFLTALVLFSKKVKIWIKLLLVGVVFVTAFFVMSTGLFVVEKYDSFLNDPSKLMQTGKAQSFLLTKKILSTQFQWVAVGAGPASFSSGMAHKSEAELFVKYIKSLFYTPNKTTINFLWSGITTLLVETGVAGFLFYYAIFVYLLFRLNRFLLMYSSKVTKYEKGFTLGTLVVVLYCLYISFWGNIFEESLVMYPFAVIVGNYLLIEDKYRGLVR